MYSKREFPALEQFPILVDGETPIVDRGKVEEALVVRIDKDFLRGYVPVLDGTTDHSLWDSEQIFLVDKNGDVLVEVRQRKDIHDRAAKKDVLHEDGETVGSALLRVENPDSVFLAVRIWTGYRYDDKPDPEKNSVGGYWVVIYRLPRNFTLREWVDTERSRRAAKATIFSELGGIQ